MLLGIKELEILEEAYDPRINMTPPSRLIVSTVHMLPSVCMLPSMGIRAVLLIELRVGRGG